jgi:hypothetical protein
VRRNYLAGLLLGGLLLGLTLLPAWWLLGVISPVAPEVLAGLGLAALIALDLLGRGTHGLAGNRTVPVEWTSGDQRRVAILWGVLLGMGLITEAPFIVLHAGLWAAATQPTPWVVVASGLLFAVGRGLSTAPRRPRRWVLIGMGNGRSPMVIASAASRAAVLGACAVVTGSALVA